VILTVLSALMGTSGLGYFGYGLWSGRRADASRAWESVSGALSAVEVVERRGRYGTRRYSVAVTYRYVVEGREYTGRRLCFGTYLWEDREEVELWLAENAARVEVFYDPKAPGSCVLMPGRAGADGTVLHVVLGFLFCLFALVFFRLAG
jgi:hypothetical protein